MTGAAIVAGTVPAPRIHRAAERWATERTHALAFLDHDGRRFDWAELARAVEAAGTVLNEAGTRPGDRVMVVLENCVAAIAFLLASSRLGAAFVPVNARLTLAEITRLRDHAEPRATIFTLAASPEAQSHAASFGARETSDPDLGPIAILGAGASVPLASEETEDVAAIIYTSGTTGTPKGVMLTHANLDFIARESGAIRRMGPEDHVYAVLPVSHVFGLSSTLLATIHAGGMTELAARFDPAKVIEAFARGVSVFQGVPVMYARMIEHLDRGGAALDAPRLRYLSAGGAPLDPDWKRRIEARFGTALNNGYGLTEAAPTIAQTRVEAPRPDDSVGPALPGVETRIVDVEGHDLAEGGVGELWVRGPNVMKGYFRNAAATAEVVTADGWLKTGDLARREPDGALFIVGRAKELIIRSGFNVYPADVEAAFNAHPAVVQTAVIGRKVDGNEEVVAFVEPVTGSGIDEGALAEFASLALSPYKRPSRIVMVDKLPASATGKIRKHELAARLEATIEGEAK